MTTQRRPVHLSVAEVNLILDALYAWEDGYRSARFRDKAKITPKELARIDRKIADIRNLKARMFRVRVPGGLLGLEQL